MKDARQGVVIWKHRLHVLDPVDDVNGSVQVAEDVVNKVSLHAAHRVQFRYPVHYGQD